MSAVLTVTRPSFLSASRALFPGRLVSRVSTMHVALAVLIVLSGGVLLSIATTTDPLWWQLHFSRLGTFNDLSGALFNNTLKISGALVVVYGLLVRRDLVRVGRRGARRGAATSAQLFLTVIGVNLALVGWVPLNVDKGLHDKVAAGMVLGFAALLLTSPVLLHRMPRRLHVSSAVIFVGLFAGAWLFVSATINLALFEVIAFGAMFAWSGVFTRCLALRGGSTPPAAPVVTAGGEAEPQPQDGVPASTVSASRCAGARVATVPTPAPASATHPAPTPRRRPARAPAPSPAARPAARRDARAPLPRGCTASAARAASGRWTTPVRR
jgi:hypothetical membrane protein